MSTNVIDAIYQDGVFKPLQPVTLAENEPVQVLVWVAPPAAKIGRRTLFGALRVLSDLSDEDLSWAKHLWDQGLDGQLHILREQGES